MSFTDWIYLLDLFGTFVFAISGVLTAIDKKFDLVGSLVIGFTTAVGGGTIRDILIGKFPVGWLNDRNYLLAILLAFIVSHLFTSKVVKLKRGLFLFDTLGIGLFTILGIQISLSYGLRVEACLIMGVISAVFGGVIRDVLTNEIPLIFRREIYASACIAGGIFYLLLGYLYDSKSFNIFFSIMVVVLIRYRSCLKLTVPNAFAP